MKRWMSIFLTAMLLLTGFSLSAAAADSAHGAPVTYLEGLSHGSTYAKEDLRAVSVHAQAAEGQSIASVEVFVDFVSAATLTAAPYTVDLSGISAGRHYLSVTATDDDGCTATEKIRITVEGTETLESIYENDLSSYSSTGSTSPVHIGSFGPESRGTATISSVTNAEKYGADHGVVAEILTQGESATDGNNAYFQVNPGRSASVYREEFDIHIASAPAKFVFSVRNATSASLSTDVSITSGGISFTNASASNLTYNWAENPGWYHCVYQVNIAKGTYSFSITKDGESTPLASTADTKMRVNTFADIQGFRTTMEIANAEKVDAAFDNFKVSIGVAEPVISDIGYGAVTGCESIPPDETAIKVYTNKILNEAAVSAETVKVYRGETPVVVDSVSYDGGVVIGLKEKLRPTTDYRVELSGEITDSAGAAIGSPLVSSFVTDYAKQDASGLTVQTDSDGSYVSGTMVDAEDSGKTLYAVLTVWKGDRLTDMTVKAILWEDGSTFRTDSVTVGEGETMEFALWDSLVCPKVVMKEL